jgi:putative redox protein
MSFSGKSFHVDFLIDYTLKWWFRYVAVRTLPYLLFLSEWKADKHKRLCPAESSRNAGRLRPQAAQGWAFHYNTKRLQFSESTMECKVSWNGPSGMSFRAETGSGHLVTMDGAPEGGGHNLAPRPMEMVLLGTGGCTAYDVVLILKRAAKPSAAASDPEGRPRRTDPKVFTKIHFHFTVGKSLKPTPWNGPWPVARQILLGVDHAGENRRNHALFEIIEEHPYPQRRNAGVCALRAAPVCVCAKRWPDPALFGV